MKAILTISAIILFLSAQAQKGTPLATYSLCFAAGFSDGVNDAVIAGHFGENEFWGINAWRNKYKYGFWRKEVLTFTTDGYHLTKIITPVLYSTAIAINIGQKQNWKRVVAKAAISFVSFRIGHELAYKVVFPGNKKQ